MDLNTGLASIGDIGIYVKNQNNYADYYDGFGWWGPLAELAPYEGYMLNTVSSGTLIYPSDALLSFEPSDDVVDGSLSKYVDMDTWNVKSSDFEFNGSITIEVNLGNSDVGENDMLAAFVDGECHGVVSATKTPFGDYLVFPLMVYGNEVGASMAFKYFDSYSGQVTDIIEEISFESDMALGNAVETIVLNSSSASVASASQFKLSPAYPNPFNPTTTFEYSIDVGGDIDISILDMNGRVIEVLYSGFSDMGHRSINWDASYNSSGVYFIKLISGNRVDTQKIVLVK